MYYYIFDIRKCKKRAQVEDIKNYLLSLGISGEYTYPSSAQTIDELIDVGLSKQFNTIVGIGGDEIANAIAGKLCGRTEAMGIIPLEVSPDLSALIGAKNWREGCENLRFRKIQEIRIGKTANNHAFITNVNLDIKSPLEVTIEFKDFLVQAKVANLTISNFSLDLPKLNENFLDITMSSINPKESLLHSIGSMLGLKNENKGLSLIRARSLRIFTKYQTPLLCGEYSIAKTPQLLEISDEKIRLIIARKGQTFWGTQ